MIAAGNRPPSARSGRPGAREELIAALAARGGEESDVRALPSRNWASATFSGARHRLEICLPSAAAVAAFEDGLADAQFALRGHLVADIVVAGRRAAGAGTLLEIEALTIEES
ncbi:hypothetical protein Q4F19_18360 [Sphingomonas sp. BIUV-7]|uniref:Uncharacterized protein n=1 Tax=Sphingomonas natans TaxID=3063330 RepID=A0ABT8YFD1_9SPHN|nr:hypothetical protein [Sphingomonas sp. BIUV-7]MDO6416355.1 hypothetical protein [Sphingomonas sp. BIUV-7]